MKARQPMRNLVIERYYDPESDGYIRAESLSEATYALLAVDPGWVIVATGGPCLTCFEHPAEALYAGRVTIEIKPPQRTREVLHEHVYRH